MESNDAVRAQLARWRERLAEIESDYYVYGLIDDYDHIVALPLLLDALEAAMGALEHIRTEQGRVCEGFELCTHESCQSSYASWAEADKALIAIAATLEGKNG